MPSKSKHRARYVTLKGVDSEKRALQRELLSWGVDTQNNPEHARFAAQVAAEVQSCQNAEPHRCCGVKPVDLPKDDVEEAVRIIFRDNIVTCPRVIHVIDDKLEGGDDDRCCNVFPTVCQNQVKVQLKNSRFSFGAAIDPLRRFECVGTVEGQERFRDMVTDLDNSDEISGLASEVIVARYASHNEACYHCKSRNTLFWAGGPWTDMICTYCSSAFEIKSKRNMEAVEKAGNAQSRFGINGGSYRGYYELHNDPGREAGWKHYLVLMSRKKSVTYDMETNSHRFTWQVLIGEIRSVEPRLSGFSFAMEPVLLRSSITLKSEPKAWFNIPYQHLDFVALYRAVLVGEFYPDLAVDTTEEAPAEENEVATTMTTMMAPTGSEVQLELVVLDDDQSVDDWEERDSDDE
jgi:hypothetical protein